MKYKEAKQWLKSRKIDFPQTDSEFSFLLNYISKIQPKTIMEIGSRSGGSLFCFGTVLNPKKIISIDLPEAKWGKANSKTALTFIINELNKQNISTQLILGNSHDKHNLEVTKQILNNTKLDFLFIDGDHTYEGVRQDFEMYSPLVVSGGLIAFHDLIAPEHNPLNVGVGKFWNEIKDSYSYVEKIEKWGIGCLVKA